MPESKIKFLDIFGTCTIFLSVGNESILATNMKNVF